MRRRRTGKPLRTAAVVVGVALAEAGVLATLNFSTPRAPAPPALAQPAPYYVAALPSRRRTPARTARKRARATPASPASAAPEPSPAATPAAPGPAEASRPDYGRWTVAGAVPAAPARPAIRMPADGGLKTADARPVHDRRAHDWKDRSPLSCAGAGNEPAHRILLDHCSGGLRLKYRF